MTHSNAWLQSYKIGKYVTRYTYGHWQIDYKTTGVLCPDGIRRTAWILGRQPDTYFTIPCKVKVKGKTVSGFVSSRSHACDDGFPLDDNDEDWAFTPNGYGKNANVLPEWKKEWGKVRGA